MKAWEPGQPEPRARHGNRGEGTGRKVKRKQAGPQEALEATNSTKHCVFVQREANGGAVHRYTAKPHDLL